MLKPNGQNQGCVSQALALGLTLSLALAIPSPVPAQAQTPPAAAWQDGATGLLGQSGGRKNTAGLAFTVWQEQWPNLVLPGGVRDGGSYQPTVLGPVGIDLGEISVPGATGAFRSERADWSGNEMHFQYTDGAGTAGDLTLWASRLTPALMVQSSASALNLFGSAVATYRLEGERVSAKSDAPSTPQFAAFGGGDSASVANLSGPVAVPANVRWMLLWYGGHSHFVDTRKPLSYIGLPAANAFQADVPMLVLFRTPPTQVQPGAQGGVTLNFATADALNAVVVLPLFGRKTLPAAQTEAWGQGLPTEIVQQANTWAARQCQFPIRAEERYAYDASGDSIQVSEHFAYQSVCSGSTASFAPVPPMLALAKEALGIRFSAPLSADALPTEFGPLYGVENADGYSWSLSGLAAYVGARRRSGSGAVPDELHQELADQVQRLSAAGHLRPWIFMDGVPRHTERGDLYWANPADTLIELAQTAQALPEGDGARTMLLDYLRRERAAYPPERVFNLNLQEGAVRPGYSSYWSDWEYQWTEGRADALQKRVPLWNAYALSEYYDLINEAPPAEMLPALAAVLDHDMRERDWATLYWFEGFQDRAVAVVNANRHFAGLLGYARLAKRANDASAFASAMPLLAQAAALRMGMMLYPRYLYQVGLVELPAGADWQLRQTAGTWNGYLFNAAWAGPEDDARQVTFLNQYGLLLYDHSGTEGGDAGACCFPHPYLTAYRDLTPELARLLANTAPVPAQTYARTAQALFPHWYAAFAEGTLGHEHNLSHPIDAYQLFLAEAYWGTAGAEKLARDADIPYLETGDLFHLHKLAEAIKAYRGVNWQTSGARLEIQPLPDRVVDKDEPVRIAIQLRPELGPLTETMQVTISLPAGLEYSAGSLSADAGSANDHAAPVLTWRGQFANSSAINMQLDAVVRESQPRWLDVDVYLEDGLGQTRLITTSLIANPRGMYLPMVLRTAP